ncbi:MAG TPA: hypothetical protein VGN35_04120 [Jatrophihabitantaceae bacterium]|nr:hypothetical protein [Jatrophihabitantaceae bacterium]
MTEPLPPILPTAEPAPTAKRSWILRRRAPLIVAAVAFVAIGTGVGIAVAAGDSPAAHVATPPATTTAPPASPSAKKHAGKGARVTIVSEAGSTWMVRTKAGQLLTVKITAQTQFGSKKSPSSAVQFTAGKIAVIVGQIENNSVTATRVAAVHGHSPGPSVSPSPAPPAATS